MPTTLDLPDPVHAHRYALDKAAPSSSGSMSASQWARGLLAALRRAGFTAPATDNNLANIQRVIGAESGGNAAGFLRDNNPWNLNTYTAPHQSLPGGQIVNKWGVNIQQFSSINDGYAAYVNQFKENPALISALVANASPADFGAALAKSGWSGAKYANPRSFPSLKIYDATASETASSNQAPGSHSWFGSILTLGGHLPGGGVITDITNAPESLVAKATKGVAGTIGNYVLKGSLSIVSAGLIFYGAVILTGRNGSAGGSSASGGAPGSSAPAQKFEPFGVDDAMVAA